MHCTCKLESAGKLTDCPLHGEEAIRRAQATLAALKLAYESLDVQQRAAVVRAIASA